MGKVVCNLYHLQRGNSLIYEFLNIEEKNGVRDTDNSQREMQMAQNTGKDAQFC